MTTHIMEIYYRAWKKANGDFLEKIESSCIQDFMQNAIFLRRASPVHAKVRQVNIFTTLFIFFFLPASEVVFFTVHSPFCDLLTVIWSYADHELLPLTARL